MAGTPMLLCIAPSTSVAKKLEGGKSRVVHLAHGDHHVDDKSSTAASAGGLSMEVKLCICVVGIYACYLSSGMLQEAITSYRADDGARFSATLFLMWVPTVTNVVFAYLAVQVNGGSGEKLPQRLFCTAGLAYISAMVLSIEALKYVNFPTKELGKSCKMIPVMLFGVLFAKKRYSLREYLCVGLITAGIVTFNLSKTAHTNIEGKENSAYGLCLLLLSLVLDGVTTSAQERLKAVCKPTMHEMMFFMNAWALAILSAAVYLSGQWAEGLLFCTENPLLMCCILSFSLASTAGQNFIFYTITTFNPLVMTTIATTRKLFTIVLSVVLYGHTIGPPQWGGVVMVFAGIGYEMRCKYHRNTDANNKKSKTNAEMSQDVLKQEVSPV
eukprot:g4428.t1